MLGEIQDVNNVVSFEIFSSYWVTSRFILIAIVTTYVRWKGILDRNVEVPVISTTKLLMNYLN